jgi:hypothetical protein
MDETKLQGIINRVVGQWFIKSPLISKPYLNAYKNEHLFNYYLIISQTDSPNSLSLDSIHLIERYYITTAIIAGKSEAKHSRFFNSVMIRVLTLPYKTLREYNTELVEELTIRTRTILKGALSTGLVGFTLGATLETILQCLPENFFELWLNEEIEMEAYSKFLNIKLQ